jgi:hypothetical protein
MVLVQVSIACLVLPACENYKLTPPIARAIRALDARTGAIIPVACYDYDEPSLTFYIGRTPAVLPHTDKPDDPELPTCVAAAQNWAHSPGPGVLVITQAGYELLQAHGLKADLVPLGRARGVNLNRRGQVTELLALGKDLATVKP